MRRGRTAPPPPGGVLAASREQAITGTPGASPERNVKPMSSKVKRTPGCERLNSGNEHELRNCQERQGYPAQPHFLLTTA